FTLRRPPDSYTLSLHDALPICRHHARYGLRSRYQKGAQVFTGQTADLIFLGDHAEKHSFLRTYRADRSNRSQCASGLLGGDNGTSIDFLCGKETKDEVVASPVER